MIRHYGNIQPSLDLEEHDGDINAKRVSLSSAATIYAVVNTGAAGVQNSMVTLNAGPNYIGLATVVPNIYGNTGLSSLASVGTATTQIVPSNINRFSLILRNISNTTIFLSMISPATTTGMYLRQDDTYETDHYRGSIFGVVGAGGGEIRYIEETV